MKSNKPGLRLEHFREANEAFPEGKYLQQHKAGGGRVFGWLCSYVPEELLHAAGVLPVRVTGCQQEREMADGNAHLSMVSCSFTRSCLQMGLESRYRLLDGFIAGLTCDGARRLYDHWVRYVGTPFKHILSVPRRCDEATLDLFVAEIELLKDKLETYLGRQISDLDLHRSIELYDESRRLLRSLYELRMGDAPPLSGAEMLEILNAASRVPKEIFNPWIGELLAQIREDPPKHRGQARIMVVGSVLNNPAYLDSIEEAGGLVVVDDLCNGLRYFEESVGKPGGEPPLKAIARRYLANLPCARMFPSHERFERLGRLAVQYRVDGVISENVRYCVPHAHDLPLVKEKMNSLGIPVLALDIEYGTSGSGQIQTRVQAFLEMLEAGRAMSSGR